MDAFMKFDGIEGSSQSKDHKGAVDVLSWNWGVTTRRRTARAAAGVRPSAGPRVPHRPPLRPRVAAPRRRSPRPASTSRTRRSTSPGPAPRKDFLTVTMKDLVVTEVLVSGDEDDVDEEVALQPSWIRFDYAEPGPGGGATGPHLQRHVGHPIEQDGLTAGLRAGGPAPRPARRRARARARALRAGDGPGAEAALAARRTDTDDVRVSAPSSRRGAPASGRRRRGSG